MCTEKNIAHINTNASPSEILNESVIHRRYIPNNAQTALIQTVKGHFFLIKIPSIGVIMMYSAVMKPDFPTVVYFIPYC